MEFHLILALGLSSLIGFSLGLMGGGGSILAVPVLVYVAQLNVEQSIAMSLSIVGSTSLVGSFLHRRSGNLDWSVAFSFSASGALGALLGAQLTALVGERTLLLLFGALMLVVSVFMLRRGVRRASPGASHHRPLPIVLLAGFGVGVMTGFLGVGGGFLIVPALVFFAGLSMHAAVGTSLFVIAINSAAGFVGHLGKGDIPLTLTVFFTLAAVLGVGLGQRLSRSLDASRLRKAFAIFVLVVGFFLLGSNW